jgi:hypothetical protein
MLIDVLKQHLEGTKPKCSAGKWVTEQPEDFQNAFKLISQKSDVNMSTLYRDLSTVDALPFGITTFKSHLKGTCSCPQQF